MKELVMQLAVAGAVALGLPGCPTSKPPAPKAGTSAAPLVAMAPAGAPRGTGNAAASAPAAVPARSAG